jgi:hypothetical protein
MPGLLTRSLARYNAEAAAIKAYETAQASEKTAQAVSKETTVDELILPAIK